MTRAGSLPAPTPERDWTGRRDALPHTHNERDDVARTSNSLATYKAVVSVLSDSNTTKTAGLGVYARDQEVILRGVAIVFLRGRSLYKVAFVINYHDLTIMGCYYTLRKFCPNFAFLQQGPN